MRSVYKLLIVCTALPLFAQEVTQIDPPQALFQLGITSQAAGELERAKIIFLTLASTYSGSRPAVKAKTELGAIYLFIEASHMWTLAETKQPMPRTVR